MMLRQIQGFSPGRGMEETRLFHKQIHFTLLYDIRNHPQFLKKVAKMQ